jgi:fatty acid desaturase
MSVAAVPSRSIEDAPTRTFTWPEISRHNKKADCWIVIDGNVYDVTSWIDRHPGGNVISSLAGEDVSALFHSSHFRDVGHVMRRFHIGAVAEYTADFAINAGFLRVLKQRVLDYFVTRRIDYRTIRLFRPQVCASVIGFLACWCLVYLCGWWIFAVPMGLISCAMVGGFAHDYSHATLIREGNRSNAVSAACSALWCVLLPFMPEKYFQYEHLQHHLKPMDAAADYEVFALRRFLRLSPDVAHRWFFRFQQFYAPLVYCFYITIQVVEGFVTTYFRRRNFRRDADAVSMIHAGWVISGVVHVVLPIALVGVVKWLAVFVAYNMVWQFTTYLVAAVVHMTRDVTPGSNEWSRYVCLTTCNVLCGNRLYGWLSGGFNYQIDHHLLPSIAREYLPQINHIVKETCREFGYPYVEYRSLGRYLGDHYRFLARLGRCERREGGSL